jgi:2-methylcitrate dehydratase PrpD
LHRHTKRERAAKAASCRAVVFKPYPSNTSPTRQWTPPCGCAPRGSPPPTSTAIELGVAKPPLRTIAEPPEAKARPASGYQRGVQPPCTVAAALLGGGLGVSHEKFTDAAARDPRRFALAALVRCVEDERCSASFQHAFPAVLRVTTRTGEELEARVEVVRGGPGNPLSDEELAREVRRQRREVPPRGARGRARGPNARPS